MASPPTAISMTSKSASTEPFANLDILARLHQLPDAAALTTSEAAVFLRASVSSLEAMRAKGTGPAYVQGGGLGASGSNQKCLYEKGDLLEWLRSQKVRSTVEAAMRKGQLFQSLFDLEKAEAFWVRDSGDILGMVEQAPVATVLGRLGVFDVEWLPVTEAAAREWGDAASHQAFADEVLDVLRREIGRVEAGVQATALAAETSRISSGGRQGGL